MAMALRGKTLIAMAGLASLSMACGGTASPTGKPTAKNTPTADTCDPNAEIPCIKGQTEPCDDYHTGYDGDEYCMKPPTNGLQIHVGPDTYDDPTALEPWILPPGGLPGQGPDVNWCYYLKTPNET